MTNDLPMIALEERSAVEVLGGIGRYTACVNEPPWSSIAPHVPAPQRVIDAWVMDIGHLERLLADEGDCETVVGSAAVRRSTRRNSSRGNAAND